MLLVKYDTVMKFLDLGRLKKALGAFKSFYYNFDTSKLGFCGNNVIVEIPIKLDKPQNVYLYDNTNIFAGATILIQTAKFIMKNNSGAAQRLTVITGNHLSRVGVLFKESMNNHEDEEMDVIIDEDVWIGANVTIMAGVHVGRGATIGAGSVCRSRTIPPYSIVAGNPAKVIGFKFTPDEVIEHEKLLYKEEERLKKDELEANYNKYFINKNVEIRKFLKL